MPIRNKILNYFVAQTERGKMPKVFLCPVTIPSHEGKQLLSKQLEKQGHPVPIGDILHVCYDLDSERIYVPNGASFDAKRKEYFLKAAEIKIANEFGGILMDKPIEGSPFSSIRVRSISSFTHVFKSVKEGFDGVEFQDLPVIEANLDRMPTTLKKLPANFSNQNFIGGYISPQQMDSINFIEEINIRGDKSKEPVLLLQQKTPCIVLDISSAKEVKSSDKERSVLFGYRDFVYDQVIKKDEDERQEIVDKASDFADLYTAKRFMYLGYPFEEVCYILLESARNFGDLYNGIQRLMIAAEEMTREGYTNPAAMPYYMSFKIDPKTFPFDFSSIANSDSTLNSAKQLPYFYIVDYDRESGFVLIQTPAYINTDLCMKILKAKTKPLITRYNQNMEKIDVKSPDGVYQDYRFNHKEQIGKILALTQHDVKSADPDFDKKLEFRTDERARGVSMSNPDICHLRKISDYHFAADKIKDMCKKRNIPFIDLPVLIGPIERIMGQGTQGGFMDEKAFKKSKIEIPFEIEKGLYVSPPLIAVNSATMPGYDEQTTTLVHEYAHNLFSITNPEYEHEYNKKENMELKKRDNLKWWNMYLGDIDERQAHKEEIKVELESGLSPDEIIRDKVGGRISLDNYPIALKFKELVDEATKEIELEEQKNEKPN